MVIIIFIDFSKKAKVAGGSIIISVLRCIPGWCVGIRPQPLLLHDESEFNRGPYVTEGRLHRPQAQCQSSQNQTSSCTLGSHLEL